MRCTTVLLTKRERKDCIECAERHYVHDERVVIEKGYLRMIRDDLRDPVETEIANAVRKLRGSVEEKSEFVDVGLVLACRRSRIETELSRALPNNAVWWVVASGDTDHESVSALR